LKIGFQINEMVNYPLICKMKILGCTDNFYKINIKSKKQTAEILFSRELKELRFISDNSFSEILKENEYQLRKILHNKRKDTFYIGFKLKFILNKNIDAVAFNDKNKLVVYDGRVGEAKIYVREKYEPDFIIMFTDGAYSEKKKKCSYVVLYKSTRNFYDIQIGLRDLQNSSLIEMIAVIEGLKGIKEEPKIRIVTDSRYVIKGITEWMRNWELNNWHTAQGEKVKNKKYWLEYSELTRGKYIEFEWVKGHSFHFENTICDKYASELLNRC